MNGKNSLLLILLLLSYIWPYFWTLVQIKCFFFMFSIHLFYYIILFQMDNQFQLKILCLYPIIQDQICLYCSVLCLNSSYNIPYTILQGKEKWPWFCYENNFFKFLLSLQKIISLYFLKHPFITYLRIKIFIKRI